MKHIVGFSGGADSQAAALWVRNRFPAADVILTNSDAGGWEDPLTVRFVRNYSRRVFPVTLCNALVSDMWSTPGAAEVRGYDGSAVLTFELLCVIKGRAPSRKAQFCTEKLKLAPQRRWLREAFGVGGEFEGEEYCRYSGVRRDESIGRSAIAVESWDSFFDCALFAPLADWTKAMCFAYLAAAGEAVNPLYRLGFSRVGCAPCINSSKEDIRTWAARRPRMIDKVRSFEQATGRSFFHPVRRDGVITLIDAAVDWAQTPRSGADPFPILPSGSACSSKFGLCE